MIPAPLLSRVKSFDAEERSDDSYSIGKVIRVTSLEQLSVAEFRGE